MIIGRQYTLCAIQQDKIDPNYQLSINYATLQISGIPKKSNMPGFLVQVK